MRLHNIMTIGDPGDQHAQFYHQLFHSAPLTPPPLFTTLTFGHHERIEVVEILAIAHSLEVILGLI